MTRNFSPLWFLVASLLCPLSVCGQSLDIPQTDLTPIAPPTSGYNPPGAGYGQFDPYAPPATGGFGGTAFGGAGNPAFGGPGPGGTTIGPPTPIGPPVSAPAQGGGGFFDGFFAQPTAPPPQPLFPSVGVPASGPMYGPSSAPIDNPSLYGAPPIGTPYPGSVYPSNTPSTLFPSGFNSMNGVNGMSMSGPIYSAFRLFQGPRFQYTYIGNGESPNDLNINNLDTSFVFAFPNFLYMAQPLYVAPSFSLHLWDGPEGSTGADLPPNAYSAFIDTGWLSDPNRMLGTELGVRVGAFTDFNTFNSDSVRVRGKGLVLLHLTPTTTFKAGVYYYDRKNIKLLPAFGYVCQPNPFTRYDIFFPEPKYARYCSTIGTQDLWWYLAGEYGDGSWSITRTSGQQERVAIDDIRIKAGFEWGDSNSIRAGQRTAFTEFGFVFNRNVDYYINTQDDFNPGDAFIVRAGFKY